MATGRTVCKFSKFQLEDIGGTLRDIPVTSYGDVGLGYDEVDLTAQQDAVKNVLLGQSNLSTTISGPFDNSPAVTASSSDATTPALSGSHTVLVPLVGRQTPISFGIYYGIQGHWTGGDPVFGATDSIIVTGYLVDLTNGTYTATIATAGNNRTNDPDWGTVQIAAST